MAAPERADLRDRIERRIAEAPADDVGRNVVWDETVASQRRSLIAVMVCGPSTRTDAGSSVHRRASAPAASGGTSRIASSSRADSAVGRIM